MNSAREIFRWKYLIISSATNPFTADYGCVVIPACPCVLRPTLNTKGISIYDPLFGAGVVSSSERVFLICSVRILIWEQLRIAVNCIYIVNAATLSCHCLHGRHSPRRRWHSSFLLGIETSRTRASERVVRHPILPDATGCRLVVFVLLAFPLRRLLLFLISVFASRFPLGIDSSSAKLYRCYAAAMCWHLVRIATLFRCYAAAMCCHLVQFCFV